MKVKLLLFTIALVYTGLILYLSLINLADTPVKDLGMSDKVMHAGAYFGLALLWMLFGIFSFGEKGIMWRLAIISVASIVFGIFIEVLQDVLTSYRELDLYDILANTFGVIIAGFAVRIVKDYLIRLKAKINLDLMKK
ncbi:VanZ family protein [Salinimicrobium xinjiangense]|uniref:VanZ family protein n=1 Tax=Salinimicrobium xinjiangense TaxID=438596 RepID=UPI000404D3D0|nr:VanZ family protein [Salinimicrobium xinjiangense]